MVAPLPRARDGFSLRDSDVGRAVDIIDCREALSQKLAGLQSLLVNHRRRGDILFFSRVGGESGRDLDGVDGGSMESDPPRFCCQQGSCAERTQAGRE
jgi:hypothetical protein